MMRRSLVAAVALLVSACPNRGTRGPEPPPQPLTPAQIAEKALPSVVLIKGTQDLGTGFVVWQDGRIVTNLHVLLQTGADTHVILPDKRDFGPNQIEVLAVDTDHDLAILRVPAKGMAALKLADSDQVKPGESVVAIGHPLGLGNTVSNGLVSAIRELGEGRKMLQISAPIAGGSSGGPLFNDRGEVIGVATLYIAEGQNLNFGVPSNEIKPLLLEEKGVPLTQMHRIIVGECSIDDVRLTVGAIDQAIKVGAPMFNAGDHEGCYRLYADTAEKLMEHIEGCSRIKAILRKGLLDAERDETPTAKAWTMRHAFDSIINMIALVTRGAGR